MGDRMFWTQQSRCETMEAVGRRGQILPFGEKLDVRSFLIFETRSHFETLAGSELAM